jgi:hypothetical protein
MSHEIICDWLKLPAKAWPPDHYTLLGLRPGEADVERIEQQVHQRLEVVRRYQLTHPEPATEAMNHLARAFVCLTDPVAKKAYDAGLLGDQPAAPEAAAPDGEAGEEAEAPVRLEAAPASVPAASWQEAPPPVRRPAAEAPPPPAPAAPAVTGPAAEARPAAPVAAAVAPPPREPADPVTEAARSSRARRGLGTKRALYRRLAHTRRLARAWEQAGKYLAWPKRRLTRPAEANELTHLLTAVRTGLDGFPPLLGEAGQPGYLVLSLARQQAVVPTFQTLLSSQREALARDWWAGRTFLQSHREFLRQELRTLRKKGLAYRAVRAARVFLSEHPAGVLILLALLALNVAVWRSFVSFDWWPAPADTRPAASGRE